MDVSKETTSLPDTAGLVHIWSHRDCDSMHKTCTNSSPAPGPQMLAWKRGSGPKVPPLARALFVIDTCLQRENQFSPIEWVTESVNHTPRQDSCSGVVDLCFPCACARTGVLQFGGFCILFLIEHEVGWVRRFRGSRKTWGRVNMIKHCMKINFLNNF